MKHLLNNLTEEEKNSIREQHTGGMNIVTENFSRLIKTKSGDVKTLVNEDETSFGGKIKRGLRKVGSIFNMNKFIAEDLLSDYVASGKITEEDRDQIMSELTERLSEINPYPYERNREGLVQDSVDRAVRIHLSNKENEPLVNEEDESLGLPHPNKTVYKERFERKLSESIGEVGRDSESIYHFLIGKLNEVMDNWRMEKEEGGQHTWDDNER